MSQKIFLALFISFFTSICIGQTQSSQLKVASYNHTTLRLVIDGKEYFQQGEVIEVDHIRQGNHRLQVFQLTTDSKPNSGLVLNKTIKIKIGKLTNIIVDTKKKKARIRYSILKPQDINPLNEQNGRHPVDPIDRSKK